MPNLNFVMPLWLYWSGLAIFPLIAAWLVRRQRRRPRTRGPSLFIAYLFWLCAGFLGIHRFYLRSAWGWVFIPVFLGILYCNAQVRAVRDNDSRTFAALQHVETQLKRIRPEVAERDPVVAERLKKTREELATRQADYAAAKAVSDYWHTTSQVVAGALALLLLADALLLPGLTRRRRAREASNPALQAGPDELPVYEPIIPEDPSRRVHTRLTDAIERLNVWVGEYVAYWAIIAVFVYYYEVLARYVFNSPTNWVHESMFLMFGIQYMLCGAYAYYEDQHVRVDVLYSQFSARGKAIADIFTSVFFFIFVGTMLWTGSRFAWDAIQVDEHSFTEWAVHYWPVKLAIPVGAALILLQGVSKLLKDIVIATRAEA